MLGHKALSQYCILRNHASINDGMQQDIDIRFSLSTLAFRFSFSCRMFSGLRTAIALVDGGSLRNLWGLPVSLSTRGFYTCSI